MDIISLLNENDRLTIIGVANKAQSFDSYFAQQTGQSQLPANQLYATTVDNKKHFLRFIESLNKTKEITNHTLAFEYSFSVIERVLKLNQFDGFPEDETPMLMVYISRGLSQMTEARTVLEAIAKGQKRLRLPVIINTCAIILDEKRVMYEKQFLKDVATQNYTKYNIDVELTSTSGRVDSNPQWYEKLKAYDVAGKMFVVNKQMPNERISTATAIVTNVWSSESNREQNVQAHLPQLDVLAKGMLIAEGMIL